jgi:hypothetical protein
MIYSKKFKRNTMIDQSLRNQIFEISGQIRKDYTDDVIDLSRQELRGVLKKRLEPVFDILTGHGSQISEMIEKIERFQVDFQEWASSCETQMKELGDKSTFDESQEIIHEMQCRHSSVQDIQKSMGTDLCRLRDDINNAQSSICNLGESLARESTALDGKCSWLYNKLSCHEENISNCMNQIGAVQSQVSSLAQTISKNQVTTEAKISENGNYLEQVLGKKIEKIDVLNK